MKIKLGYDSIRAMAHLPRLDSLRALAAFSVLAYHFGRFGCGWMGVPFFFVLSGYLITGILIRSRDRSVKLGEYLRVFFIRRALRIMPLYFGFVFGLTVLFWLTGTPHSFLQAMPFLYTYTLNIARMLPGYVHEYYDPLWSLGVEWQFYLAWPFFIYLLPRKSLFTFLLLVIILVPILRLVTVMGLAHAHFTEDQILCVSNNSPLTYMDAFAFGAILNWQGAVAFFRKPIMQCAGIALFAFGGLICLRLDKLTGTANYRDFGYDMISHGQAFWGYTAINLLMTCILGATLGESILNRVTNLSILQYLGKISYGIYVFHHAILDFFKWKFPIMVKAPYGLSEHILKFGLSFSVVAITILCAHLSYEFFESYFLKLKSKTIPRGTSGSAGMELPQDQLPVELKQ